MTEGVDHNSTIPTRSDRVREALLRFETCTKRPGTMLSLSQDTLFEIGLLLSDPKLSMLDAWKQTNELLGPGEDGGEAVTRSTFYRFGDRFKALLGQVTAEYAQRKIRLTVANATDDNIAKLNKLSRHRFAELLAEKLVDTDDLDEIDRYMNKMAAFLGEAERARQADERLELDQLNYERRLSETRSKLELAEQRVAAMQIDTERKASRIDERLTALQTRLDGLKKRASRGEVITAAELAHADADLAAVRAEVQEVAA